MLNEKNITKQDLEKYLFELAKAYKKVSKRNLQNLEIVLVGGASILINYTFRVSTTDVDGTFLTPDALLIAIKNVAEKFELGPKWINTDFEKSPSYSDQLRINSVFYQDYLGVISVRTIRSEYLVAMKLVAGRMHKNDITDIIGILHESRKNNEPLSVDKIKDAVLTLYGKLDKVSTTTWKLFNQIIENGDYESLFLQYRQEEIENQAALIDFRKNATERLTKEDLDEILRSIQKKREQEKSDRLGIKNEE
ncbi:MAG: Uncharacterized protein FD133_294 [Erysipelotrichaceae bacterium]|nr:MAG: hypothetical protein FD179_1908 [Erysipelotrichaceae bacterium]TXT19660.1 MAG: Uncharacterized protein FD133_294 [Erysipelotrichaceae bacterium]